MSTAIISSAQVAAPLAGVALDLGALVPKDDRALYASLPDRAKADLRAWLVCLAPLIREGRSPRHLTRRLADVAASLHTSAVQVRRKWDAWWQHGWKGVVNRSLAGPAWQERADGGFVGVASRKEFLDWVRNKFGDNKRSSEAAWGFVIIPQWKRWRATRDPRYAIPGYETPPPPAEGKDFPAGWSYSNLLKLTRNRFELLADRIGRDAAYRERPTVCTTRVGLWVGSHYSFDDKWHDFFVNSFAEGQAGRPLELCSRDLYSARKLRWGVRVRVKDEAGKYKGLTGMMARMILAATLYLDGYSPRGTVCIIEHGTATFPKWLRAAITELTGGLVTFSLSGMQGAVAHDGQYEGPGRGNPRHKASHESHNGYEHNVLADMPGQTGKDTEHRPEGLGRLLDENALLLRALATLPEARGEKLEFELIELGEFHRRAHAKYRQIDDHQDHALTDWAQCGHLVQQMWTEEGWRDVPHMDTLPEDIRARFNAALDSGAVRTRLRQMSRLEVWEQGAGELIKLPGHGVWDILQQDLAAPRAVAANELAFEDAEIAPGKLRFSTRGIDAFGRVVDLRDRETYRVVVNPFAPETAFVGDLAGRYIGEFPAVLRPTRTDENDPAMQEAFGALAKREAELLAPIRERRAGEAAAKDARQRRNAALCDVDQPTKEERREAQRKRDGHIPGNLSDLLHGGLSVRGGSNPDTASAVPVTPAPEMEQAEAEDLGPLW